MLQARDAAKFLQLCQVNEGEIKGTVCPWELNAGMEPREDFHDTLEALYIWSLPENLDKNMEYINRALGYLRFRFDKYKKSSEPIISYESAFILFSIGEYRKNTQDTSFDYMINFADNYLKNYFIKNPNHELRDYSNAYWKAGMLRNYLSTMEESFNIVDKWIIENFSLVNPSLEINNDGPGYMFHHDFMSTYGSKLYAIKDMINNIEIDNFLNTIPEGYTKRKYDEIVFNSTVMIGLLSIFPFVTSNIQKKIVTSIKEIQREIDSHVNQGGLTRGGNYFNIRESWPTFFYAYASKLLADLDL